MFKGGYALRCPFAKKLCSLKSDVASTMDAVLIIGSGADRDCDLWDHVRSYYRATTQDSAATSSPTALLMLLILP
jgi:hypothetical protein